MCVVREDEKSVYRIFFLHTLESKEQVCIMQKSSTKPGLPESDLHLQSCT